MFWLGKYHGRIFSDGKIVIIVVTIDRLKGNTYTWNHRFSRDDPGVFLLLFPETSPLIVLVRKSLTWKYFVCCIIVFFPYWNGSLGVNILFFCKIGLDFLFDDLWNFEGNPLSGTWSPKACQETTLVTPSMMFAKASCKTLLSQSWRAVDPHTKLFPLGGYCVK